MEGPGNSIALPASSRMGSAFLLPPVPGSPAPSHAPSFTDQLQANAAFPVVARVIGIDRGTSAPTSAQQAVLSALFGIDASQARDLGIEPALLLRPGSAAALAAHRFALMPDHARHSWLVEHVTALQAGHVTLAQLP